MLVARGLRDMLRTEFDHLRAVAGIAQEVVGMVSTSVSHREAVGGHRNGV